MVVFPFPFGVREHRGFFPRAFVLSGAGGFLDHDDGAVAASLLDEGAPGLELVDVLDLDDVGPYGLNVAVEVFGKCPGVGVAGHAALGSAEVRTFKAGP